MSRQKSTAAEVLRRYADDERNFSDLDLRGLSFTRAELSEADFSGSDIRGTNFVGAILTGAKFSDCRAGQLSHWVVGTTMLSIFFVPGMAFVVAAAIISFGASQTGALNEALLFGILTLLTSLMPVLRAWKSSGFDAARFVASTNVGIIVFVFGGLMALMVSLSASSLPRWTPRIVAFFLGALLLAGVSALNRRLAAPGRDVRVRRRVFALLGFGGTNFQRAILDTADFTDALVGGTDFREASLLMTWWDAARGLDYARFGYRRLDPAGEYGLMYHCLNQSRIQQLATTKRGINGDFKDCSLPGMNLYRANLAKAQFEHASLPGALLQEANLQEADLSQAELQGATLAQADLQRATLTDANLAVANLIGANLQGANLTRTNLENAKLTGARVDLVTYERSAWEPPGLLELKHRGIEIIDLGSFPKVVRDFVVSSQDGLTLCFGTRLAPVDRFLIDSVIYGVLGKDTDCQVVEFKQGDGTATVRLQAARREDLESIAEMLYRRVWEYEDHTREQILVKFVTLLAPSAICQLSDLRQRMERMELRFQEATSQQVELVRLWDTTVTAPPTAYLRHLIDISLIGDSDFDAFCLDYFPTVRKYFSNGMDRVAKVTILLERMDPNQILARLSERCPDAMKVLPPPSVKSPAVLSGG